MWLQQGTGAEVEPWTDGVASLLTRLLGWVWKTKFKWMRPKCNLNTCREKVWDERQGFKNPAKDRAEETRLWSWAGLLQGSDGAAWRKEKGHSLHTTANLINAVDYRCGEHGGNKMLGTDTYGFTRDGVSLSSFRFLEWLLLPPTLAGVQYLQGQGPDLLCWCSTQGPRTMLHTK